jgi:OPA family glycerol-3-phosphate transporter-like MFS transporter/OPA family sugar phosphate sensor protein UhpC-like MFS transporter
LKNAAFPVMDNSAHAPSRSFRHWQWRTIIATMIGYSLFYFVRKNLSVAMPGLQAEFGISKAQLGVFLTAHGLIYGVSKFLNGIIGDRVNSRRFMVAGLVLASLCSVAFAFGPAVAAAIAGAGAGEKFLGALVVCLGVIWMVNGWFQGMGFPPCARLITHWVPPAELATKMSVWNASHSIGAGFVVILCGYVVALGWRWCFWLPAAIAIAGAGALWFALRDTPSSVGLPELPGAGHVAQTAKSARSQENAASSGRLSSLTLRSKDNLPGAGKKAEAAETENKNENKTENKNEDDTAAFKRFIRENVFLNPVVWIIGAGQFFVYVMRSAVLDWGPTFLGEHYGISIKSSTWMTAGFEIAGIAGMLLAG